MPARACARAPLAAAGRPAPVPVPGSGSGSGSGLGLGLGSGSLPGLVLFESGLKGMGRSATRPAPRPDPLSGSKAPVGQPTGATAGQPTGATAGQPTGATVGSNRARDRVLVLVWVWVPYLAWFFLNRVSRVWAAPLPELDPLRDPTRYPDPKLQLDNQRSQLLGSQQVRLLGRTVATVQTEPLQPFVGFEHVGPSWSAI